MALRKFLFLNTTEGVAEEQNQTTDSVQVGQVIAVGIGGVAFNASSQLISNLATPVSPTDAATKAYVDSASQGLSVKSSVVAMSSTNIASLSGPLTIDGISVIAGQRVLLTGQTTASQNGIWVVQSGTWTRSTDLAVGVSAAGTFTFVEEGTVNAAQGWVNTNIPGSDVVGTNSLTYTQFTGTGDITAGNGIARTGNTLAVSLAANPGLQFTGNALAALLVSTGGLQVGASGLSVFVNANNTLATDASGLRTLGLPSAFTIAGTAVSTAVSASNLNTLTAGTASAADALHTHTAVTGATAVQATFSNGSASLNIGDPVCWSSTANTLVRADASVDASSRVFGLAGAAISASASGVIVSGGVIAGCLTGATPGAPYWLASGGGLTATIPTTSGNRVVRIGFAKNATDLYVHFQDMGKRS